jgi:hypothetical protein
MAQKVKPFWHFTQIAYANMKQASDYPKLYFEYKPRRAYFLNLTRYAFLSLDAVPNPALRQSGRGRDLIILVIIKPKIIIKETYESKSTQPNCQPYLEYRR